MMGDLLSHLAARPRLGIHQHIRLAIRSLPGGEEGANLRQRVGITKQRPVGLVADALQNRLRRRPQTNHQGMSLEAREILRIASKSAPGGNHCPAPLLEQKADLAFEITKCRLPILGKDLGNRFTDPLFDHQVGVYKLEAQTLGKQVSSRRFAHAHESNERHIPNRSGRRNHHKKQKLTKQPVLGELIRKQPMRFPLFREKRVGVGAFVLRQAQLTAQSNGVSHHNRPIHQGNLTRIDVIGLGPTRSIRVRLAIAPGE